MGTQDNTSSYMIKNPPKIIYSVLLQCILKQRFFAYFMLFFSFHYSPLNMAVFALYRIFSLVFVYYTLSFVIAQIDITVARRKQTEEVNYEDSALSNQTRFKELFLDWWRNNSVPKPLKCNYKIRASYKNKYISRMTIPEIKSFPCRANTYSLNYTFTGSIENGYLEGKGRLLLLDEKDWIKLSKQKREDITNKNVCFTISRFVNDPDIKEIIGTFKDGYLHGIAKITFTDYSFSITTYKNGKICGYQRSFDQNEHLLDAGVYQKGLKTGHFWKNVSHHLLYQDQSMVVDDIKPTIVFPFLEDGTLGDPFAGDYFPHYGALENIHRILLTNIAPTISSDCVLHVQYRIQEKQNYTYYIDSKEKFPSYGSKNQTLLCDIIPNKSSEKLENWFTSIDTLLRPTTIPRKGLEVARVHEVLWRLKPVLEEPDNNKSTKLISDIVLNQKNKSITARILGSPAVEITFTLGSARLDSKNKLNGVNDIMIIQEHWKHIPNDITLRWAPIRIIGIFVHGELNGFTRIDTNVATQAWVTVKNGVIHGPSVIYGISHIMEPVSKTVIIFSR